MRLEPVIVGLLFAFTSTAATNPSAVTFTKDVAPVLQKNCQGCHRPGEAAPFSLLTYEQARPWAKAMKEAVLLKKMPPWFADPHWQVSNDRSLAEEHRRVVAADAARRRRSWDMPPQPVLSKAGAFRSLTCVEMPKHSRFPRPGPSNISTSWYRPDSPRTNGCAFRKPSENRQLVHHIIAFIRSRTRSG
jgi:hypothetical protein